MNTIKVRRIDKDRFYFICFNNKSLTGYYGICGLTKLLVKIGAPNTVLDAINGYNVNITFTF